MLYVSFFLQINSHRKIMSTQMRFCSSSSTFVLIYFHIHLLIVISYLSTYIEGSKGVFSVIDYGAVGDGFHDDTKVHYLMTYVSFIRSLVIFDLDSINFL